MTSAQRQRLAKARIDAGLSVSEVARRIAWEIGGSPATWRVSITKYESGATTPAPRSLAAWTRAVGSADPDVPLVRLDVLNVVEPHLARWIDTYGGEATAAELRTVAAGAEAIARVHAMVKARDAAKR